MSALRLMASVLALATAAQAYYHFTVFTSRLGPFRPVHRKFDVNALPGRVLPFFIAEPQSVRLGINDSFPALVSQIRAAARVWNDVETSDLRLSFAGIAPQRTPQGSPSVEVLFDELPPGIVAMGGPTVPADSNGVFVPILKSEVRLSPDLTNRPSHGEAMFTTLVHELGHALGLQHTFTSSVMSTAITRSTSKARPLTTDDVAGLSILYPRGNFQQSSGSISGRVTLSGQGVNLASVVAIAANGAAVSTLTSPDGTYRIEGLPARGFYVYVHPLPPARPGQSSPGDIVYPADSEGRVFTAGPSFETVFFSTFNVNGVKDYLQATPVGVTVGASTDGVNFAVRARTGFAIHSVETYAYPGETAVKPPYLTSGMLRPFVIATGSGLVNNSAPVPGLTATVLGGADLTVRPLSTAPSAWIQLMLNSQNLLVSSDSARHLILSANNDIYVLPSAFFHVERQPPQILGLNPDLAARTVTVTGVNLTPETRFLFDGAQAQVRQMEEANGLVRAVLVPPQAAPGHRAVVTALNPDGQSTLFLQSDAPPYYIYPAEPATAPSLILTPNTLPAGVESVIQVDAVNTQFVDGQVAVGFGTTDVTVRRVWVVSPTRLLVNVSVAPTAQLSIPQLTVVSGLQMIPQQSAFVVQGPLPRSFWLSSLYFNASTGLQSVSAGSQVTILLGGSPVAPATTNTTVLLGENRVPVSAVNQGQITFTIPAGTPAGPLVVRLEVAGERSLPIVVSVDAPTIRVVSASGTSGDLVSLLVTGLTTDVGLGVTVGGRVARVIGAIRDGDRYTVIVQIPADVPRGDVPVVVTSGSAVSEPYTLRIGS